MGIVHHSNYLRYFECARDEMIASWGYGIEKCQEDGIVFPVVSIEIKYKHSLHPGDTAVVSAEIPSLPMAKLIVNQRVCNQNGDVCAEGTVTLGFIDTKSGKLTRCPQKFLEIMQALQEEQA